MSNICLEVEFLPGTSIEEACAEAISQVNFFGFAYIKFNFNGVSMSIGKNATIEKCVSEFHRALKDSKYKFAVVNS